MSRYSNVLLLCVAVLISSVVVVIFISYFNGLNTSAHRMMDGTQELSVVREGSPFRVPKTPVIRRRASSMRTVELLRDRLEQRTEQYRQQQSQLTLRSRQHDELSSSYNALVEKHQVLQHEYDALLSDADSALLSLIALMREEDQASPADPGQDTQSSEVEQQDSQFSSADEQAGLEFISWELEQANVRIAALQTKVDRESRVAMASSSVLVDVGEPAIPMVIHMTTDDRPEIRAWAAWVLGFIRPVSDESKAALTRLTRDEDADVVKAADTALVNLQK